jgi:hypothetical protein
MYSMAALAERDADQPFSKPAVPAPVPAPDDEDEDDLEELAFLGLVQKAYTDLEAVA